MSPWHAPLPFTHNMLDNYESLEFPQPVWSVSRVWQPLLVAALYVSLASYASFCIIV
jgi:hypothetical protein